MRAIILILALFTSVNAAYSQAAVPSTLRAQFTLGRLGEWDGIQPGDMLYGLPAPEGDVIGDVYLEENWQKAKILMYGSDKILDGFSVKYDIKSEMLEIKAPNAIKVLEASKVKTLVLVDPISNKERFFVNAKEYRLDGSPLTGLLEVITDGNAPLFKKTTLYQKDPTYVAAVDLGSRDTKLIKKEKFYYARKNALTKVDGKKSLLNSLGEHSTEVGDFIKTNKLSADKEYGLIRIFEFYNSRLTQ